ncbi:hypothetical protein CLV24_111114 [Pontibacter ummariensis]|uniref:Uncharacterized protein n=1 Tax=Pontibacter ummariensis TaxID=1610492 RepID=A0A239GKM9_9BACT|nr:hypothetical protein CLV24_111114 [Pontibacter ummariensis]SNS69719.1 hypothetical protein SAMN06296052_111114 [Pontibacter ummariensis]
MQEALIVGLVMAFSGVSYLVYRLYRRKKPPRKFHDHYW